MVVDQVVSRWADPPPHRSRQRVSVAGVSGGVGTTTLAAAVDGIDRGVFVGRPVDVLVCRGTVESLRRAGRAAQLQTDGSGHMPLLAVTATGPGSPGRPVSVQLRQISTYAVGVVAVPWVRAWPNSTTRLQDARAVLTGGPSQMPRSLRGYARAVRDIRRHLGSPGVVDRPFRGRGPWGAPARTTEQTR